MSYLWFDCEKQGKKSNIIKIYYKFIHFLLVNLNIIKNKKQNQFKIIYENNLLTLNLFFIFSLYVLSHFFMHFSRTKNNLKMFNNLYIYIYIYIYIYVSIAF